MSELFNGVWKIDFSQSSVWDADSETYVPDEAGEEIITIKVADGVQDYDVQYGDNPVIRLGYTARYDSPDWVPYMVREIIVPEGESVEQAVEAFRKRTKADSGPNARQFKVGQPYGYLRMALVDDRTHYRINRTTAGDAQYVMMRRLSDDGTFYRAFVLDVNGIVFRIRHFVRVG
jgi:hypothetical protein